MTTPKEGLTDPRRDCFAWIARPVLAGETAATEVRELTAGLGATLVLDCVGSTPTMALAAAAARAGGAIQIIGLGGGSLPLVAGGLPFDCSLTTPY